MLRHFSFLCAAAAAAIVSLFLACSKGGGGSGGDEEGGAVKLYLGKIQVPMFDSITVTIYAPDMTTIHISKKSLEDNLKITGIPQGESRVFEVKIYADSGTLVQEGEAAADIKADETVEISVPMNALFGFLRIEVPLGLSNSEGISSGKLFLDNVVYYLEFESGKGVFNTKALPLNKKLVLYIELYDKNGHCIFEGEDEITLNSISKTQTIKLHSNKGSAILELKASPEGLTQVLATLPSTIRSPKNYGDVFFTEIFADPKSNGDGYEYLEIYNATIDNLDLSHCRIARSRNATTVSQTFNMPDTLIIPPMEFLFFGRDSVDGAYFKYTGFTLTNTGQSLGIFCDNIVIDSIYFSTATENKFPLTRGKAMQLPLENYKTRALGSSWCLGFSPRENAICQ